MLGCRKVMGAGLLRELRLLLTCSHWRCQQWDRGNAGQRKSRWKYPNNATAAQIGEVSGRQLARKRLNLQIILRRPENRRQSSRLYGGEREIFRDISGVHQTAQQPLAASHFEKYRPATLPNRPTPFRTGKHQGNCSVSSFSGALDSMSSRWRMGSSARARRLA